MMTERAAPRLPRKNWSRERMQAELRHLRMLAQELEKKRDELQKQAAVVPVDKAWRDVVQFEAAQTERAQELNRHLRARLEEHRSVIRHLRKLIRDKLDTARRVYDSLPESHSGPDLFDTFLKEIHEGYRMTDSIVDSSTWEESMNHRAWQVSTRSSEQNGHPQKVMVLQNQFWYPTNEFTVGDGDMKSWSYTPQYFQASCFSIEDLCVQENSLTVRYRRVLSTEVGQDTRVYVNWMMKRFVEKTREVRVWRTKMMGEGNQGVDQSAFLDVVGWTIHQPVATGVILHICAHLVPRFLDTEATTGGNTPHVGDLVGCVLKSLQMDISRAIENLSTS